MLAQSKYIPLPDLTKNSDSSSKALYIETYGCQMNFADTEIVNGIMENNGYSISDDISKASLILLNTCSIRENAELRIYQRLTELKKLKIANPFLMVGIIGCMAERLRKDIMKKSKVVDLIVGPDEYRRLPLLAKALEANSEKGVAV